MGLSTHRVAYRGTLDQMIYSTTLQHVLPLCGVCDRIVATHFTARRPLCASADRSSVEWVSVAEFCALQRSPRSERLHERRVNRRCGGTRFLLLPLLLELCIVDEHSTSTWKYAPSWRVR